MSEATRGSQKLKAQCQTLASLSAEEINEIAGGYSGTLLQTWWIRGIPAFKFTMQDQVTPEIPNVDVGGFGGFGF